jgi:hypothetical protein
LGDLYPGGIRSHGSNLNRYVETIPLELTVRQWDKGSTYVQLRTKCHSKITVKHVLMAILVSKLLDLVAHTCHNKLVNVSR